MSSEHLDKVAGPAGIVADAGALYWANLKVAGWWDKGGGWDEVGFQCPRDGCPGQEVLGSMLIGSMGYLTPIHPPSISR